MIGSKTAWLVRLMMLMPLASQAAILRGRVISLNGNPLVGAVVHEEERGIRVLSDKQGEFAIEIEVCRQIELRVTHPGYLEKTLVIFSQEFGQEIVVKLLPYIRKREDILVTASRYPEKTESIPAAESVMSREGLNAQMPPNIAEGINNLPGISMVGAGGFSLSPNIRGFARRRVLVMVDNARITSDRRTGPNASFVSSRDIEKIEVLRSPSSVYYGSEPSAVWFTY